MKSDCLEIGIVQAFMDGELGLEESARVSGHIADCDACALMLADAEDEMALVFPALEREFNSLVPTQRLWARINDSITVERKNRPFWVKAMDLISIGLLTPSMAAAASLVIVVGVVGLAFLNRGLTPEPIAKVKPSVVTSVPSAPPLADLATTQRPAETASEVPAPAAGIERADYRPAVRRDAPSQSFTAVPVSARESASSSMPGEESYVRTIAALSRSVADQKDTALRGSERISFERDLAVVDDAINKMRTEVKRNPRNESAKQVLYSSYQNKIDLLNSVSQKEELVASLR